MNLALIFKKVYKKVGIKSQLYPISPQILTAWLFLRYNIKLTECLYMIFETCHFLLITIEDSVKP